VLKAGTSSNVNRAEVTLLSAQCKRVLPHWSAHWWGNTFRQGIAYKNTCLKWHKAYSLTGRLQP